MPGTLTRDIDMDSTKNDLDNDAENSNLDFSEEISFVEWEHQVLNFWQQEKIFQQSLDQSINKPPYIFYDGPPFATGLPHHGHLVGSTLKDTVPRYFTMKGRYVERRFGWDCHGLPIEYEIDKATGISAHSYVKEHGVKKYNDLCRSIVQKYVSEWQKTIHRIGRWVDFDHDYKTMDTSFMESVWWVFHQLWNKGLIYKSLKVMPFSTALGTPLSNFEAGSNYQDVQDPAITVLCRLKNQSPEAPRFLTIWTTTPWTLPSNLGICAHADIIYVDVQFQDQKNILVMAKDRVEAYAKKLKATYTILNEYPGSQLKGLSYEPLFPFFQELASDGAFQVQNDDYVTSLDGTGLVHLAPFGEDDYRILKQIGASLAQVCPVDDQGKFTKEVTLWAGQYIKDADKDIIKNLKERSLLLDFATIVHSFPFCPRSKTPLLYKPIPSWFVNVEKIKDDMLAANEHIHWVPEHLQAGRFGQWLKNARDWAISRNRIWGTPLPIWINAENGKAKCFGSIAELQKYATFPLTDIHREFVDDITFTLPGESGIYRRIPEVLDCWFESGSMPYAQQHYPFENVKYFEQGFPAEFIAEGLDQTRGWFYTLTVLSAALFKKPAFKNVIVNGLVLANDGKKMSKSLKNYTAPDELMEKYGADALRLFLINSALVKAEDLKFHDDGPKEMVRKVLLPWYNSFKFFMTYAQADNWKPDLQNNAISKFNPHHILDRWILSKLQSLILKVDQEMNQYHLYNVVPELFLFIDHLTNWYIRLNRRRFWGEEGASQTQNLDQHQAFTTLFLVLDHLNKIMAPFAPFLSETLFQQLKKLTPDAPASVHLCTYPEADMHHVDALLEDAVLRMQQIILMGRQARTQHKLKVKIPLRSLTIIHPDSKILQEILRLKTTLEQELNVKEILTTQAEDKYIKIQLKPNFPILGKKLGAQMSAATKILQQLTPSQIKTLEQTGKVSVQNFAFTTEDVQIIRTSLQNWDVKTHPLVSIILDPQLDENLKQEGFVREVVSHIQKMRKDLRLQVTDRCSLTLAADPVLTIAIEKFATYLKQETLCTQLTVTNLNPEPNKTTPVGTVEIDGLPLHISLAKNEVL